MSSIDLFKPKDQLRVRVLYEQLNDSWLQRHVGNEELLKVTYRNIGNALFDFDCVWTQYMSVGAIQLITSTNAALQKACAWDHFYGRMNSGEQVAQLFINNKPTMNDFVDLVYQHRKVHRVLKEENNIVSTHQNNKGMSWKGAYRAAGIELVKISMGDRKRVTLQLLEQYKDTLPTPLSDIVL